MRRPKLLGVNQKLTAHGYAWTPAPALSMKIAPSAKRLGPHASGCMAWVRPSSLRAIARSIVPPASRTSAVKSEMVHRWILGVSYQA